MWNMGQILSFPNCKPNTIYEETCSLRQWFERSTLQITKFLFAFYFCLQIICLLSLDFLFWFDGIRMYTTGSNIIKYEDVFAHTASSFLRTACSCNYYLIIYKVKGFLALVTLTNFRELSELLGSWLMWWRKLPFCGSFYRSCAHAWELDVFTATD